MDNLNNINEHDLLWDRNHIKNEKYHNKYENWYVIHGHTPVQLLRLNEDIRVYKYNYNHKIDIDMATYVSNAIAVLDLDTFEVKYFKGDEENSE